MDKLKVSIELPQSIDNAIYNLTDKPTAAIGTTFADIWYLVFGAASYHADEKRIKREYDLNQYRGQLDSAISSIPSDKFVEPSIQVTAQALDNSKYCISEKELRNMFVSLISKSMNKDYLHDIHPSFSEIIKQMSTLDAQIISLFHESTPGLPVCQYSVMIPGSNNPNTIPEHIFLELPKENIFSVSMSLASLSRFGLISISYLKYLHDPTFYQKFSEHPFYKGLKQSWPGDIQMRKGLVSLTPLGRSFVRVCVPD